MTPSMWKLTRGGHEPLEVRTGVYVCCRCGAGARWTGSLLVGTMTGEKSKCFDVEEER